MKKIGIGTVALGAGILLVLGGAGSTAYWQAAHESPAVTLSTGDLDLALERERWRVNGVTVVPQPGESVIDALAEMPLVPGTHIQWVQQFDLDRVGTDLDVELDLDLGALTKNDAGEDFPENLTITSKYSSFLLDQTTNESITFAAPSQATTAVTGSGSFTVTVEITWPFGDSPTDPTNSTNRSLQFGETTLTARQTTPEN